MRGPKPRPVLERFWEKVEKTPTCWIWKGGKMIDGYGYFWDGSTMVLAHRLSYEISNGLIPNGLTLDHLCRNRACVNPSHLEPVSLGENVLRGIGLTAQNARQTHCKRGHPLISENISSSRLKRRQRECLLCRREKWHKNHPEAKYRRRR